MTPFFKGSRRLQVDSNPWLVPEADGTPVVKSYKQMHPSGNRTCKFQQCSAPQNGMTALIASPGPNMFMLGSLSDVVVKVILFGGFRDGHPIFEEPFDEPTCRNRPGGPKHMFLGFRFLGFSGGSIQTHNKF